MSATVLIVEDDRDVRDFLQLALSPMYRLEMAPDGRAGWEKFQDLKPDLVLTDLVLPGINGLDLTEKIRAHGERGATPVIILTGATKDEALDPSVWRLGTEADQFLEKPVDPGYLRSEIDRLLKERAGYRPVPPGKGSYD